MTGNQTTMFTSTEIVNQTDQGSKFSDAMGKAGTFATKAMKLTTIKIKPAIFMSVFLDIYTKLR